MLLGIPGPCRCRVEFGKLGPLGLFPSIVRLEAYSGLVMRSLEVGEISGASPNPLKDTGT